ncbi:hypothetical protein [Cereibacter sphaeroides]|uniref:hypothetical protein n=1 Tax=Cereibacter sphaeroides TaxID=1063 RepID=UPI0015FB9BAE|nr:hypothetical protein [Cereibacter sphaeroides]
MPNIAQPATMLSGATMSPTIAPTIRTASMSGSNSRRKAITLCWALEERKVEGFGRAGDKDAEPAGEGGKKGPAGARGRDPGQRHTCQKGPSAA